MNCKIALFFVALFLVIQVSLASTRFARDTPAAEEKKTDTLDEMKAKVDEFFKDKFQVDKLLEGLSSNLKSIGEKIGAQAEQFSKSFKEKTDELVKKDEA